MHFELNISLIMVYCNNSLHFVLICFYFLTISFMSGCSSDKQSPQRGPEKMRNALMNSKREDEEEEKKIMEEEEEMMREEEEMMLMMDEDERMIDEFAVLGLMVLSNYIDHGVNTFEDMVGSIGQQIRALESDESTRPSSR
jgi:hypothetical protein